MFLFLSLVFVHALIDLLIRSHGAECPAVCLQRCIRVTGFAHSRYSIAESWRVNIQIQSLQACI